MVASHTVADLPRGDRRELGIWALGLFDDEDLDEALEDELVEERDGELPTDRGPDWRTPRSGDIEGDEGERFH